MTHLVRLNNGVTTVTLTSGVYVLNSYPMRSADINTSSPNSAAQDADITGVVYNDVRETITFFIDASSPSNAQDSLNLVEQFFPLAHRREITDTGNFVYIEVQLTSDSAIWRSEIVTGRVTPSSDAFTSLPQSKIACTLEITRRYFWEVVTPVSLSLSNGGGSGTTLNITNYNSGSNYNYGDVSSGSISGSLPAPAVVKVTNKAGSAVEFKNVYMGINAFAGPSGFTHVFEGESADGGNGSAVSDSSCSGGSRYDFSWTGASSKMAYWLPSSTFLNYAAGQRFRVIARFKGGVSSNVFLKVMAGVYDSPLFIPTWTGDEVQGNGEWLLDLGSIRLPNANYIPGTNYSSGFGITFRTTSTGSLSLDFVALFLADNFRKLEQIPSLLINDGETVEDDSRYHESYYKYASGLKYNVFEGMGSDLYVWPGKTNRVQVLFDEGPTHTINRPMYLQLQYYPRRLTI